MHSIALPSIEYCHASLKSHISPRNAAASAPCKPLITFPLITQFPFIQILSDLRQVHRASLF
ncbi:hypothetical protein K469DRAFT_701187 [Zopfia rhizophila CBS 207.26]|uniref:Uncharacterized protein n=1 Tax=Zopfia rhizophila CBS 207.26 TaxID=1314779 RepID=A0A6A6DTC9_9PEZI|nr:hypothetical protein K469DRAFT_231597 [Zopfia rhizophila CBS 207.26]KAF2189909.1 hypothetical protein K469DRAFT_701187 [Zopfia rhizophila CBS 207.26]